MRRSRGASLALFSLRTGATARPQMFLLCPKVNHYLSPLAILRRARPGDGSLRSQTRSQGPRWREYRFLRPASF